MFFSDGVIVAFSGLVIGAFLSGWTIHRPDSIENGIENHTNGPDGIENHTKHQ
jgi:ABC-type lipoprotein release transport system permease subunit